MKTWLPTLHQSACWSYDSSYPNSWTRPQDTPLFGVATHSQSKQNNPPFPSRVPQNWQCRLLSPPLQIWLQTTPVRNHRLIRPTHLHRLLSWHWPTGRCPSLGCTYSRDFVCENHKQIKRQRTALVESNTHRELAFGKHYGLACTSLTLLFRAVKSTGKK